MAQDPITMRRRLGNSDLAVSPVGLGCMSLSGVYGPADDAQSEDLISHANAGAPGIVVGSIAGVFV